MAIRGDGVVEPLGIKDNSDIQKIDPLGPLDNYVEMSQAVQKVREQNGEPNALLWSPRSAGEADRFKTATEGNPLPQPVSVAALQKFVTTQIPVNLGGGSNETEIYVGPFRELLIGLRLGLTLVASREAGDNFQKYKVAFRGVLRADIALAQEAQFVLIEGIEPQP